MIVVRTVGWSCGIGNLGRLDTRRINLEGDLPCATDYKRDAEPVRRLSENGREFPTLVYRLDHVSALPPEALHDSKKVPSTLLGDDGHHHTRARNIATTFRGPTMSPYNFRLDCAQSRVKHRIRAFTRLLHGDIHNRPMTFFWSLLCSVRGYVAADQRDDT